MNTSTVSRKNVLEPTDPLAARFCKYFKHGWDFIIAPTPSPGQKPAWKSENAYPLQPRNLWRLHQDPNYIIGLRFGGKTNYAGIDIDRNSPYHPSNHPDKFRQVLAAMESIGLCRYVMLRSSDSEGIHLYYPLLESVWTFGVACAIKFALFDSCIVLESGQVESFPNTKRYGKQGEITLYNGLRLPLQAGSYLLDSDNQPYSNSVNDLLDAFDWAAAGQDMEQLQKAISFSKPRQKLCYSSGTSDRALLWRRHLEERCMQGWSGFGQTNTLLKDIACYGRVWLGLDGETLVNYTVATATSAPGYDCFCCHQKEIWHRAADWSKCVEAYYWVYGSEPSRRGKYASHFHRDDKNDCPHCTHPQNNIVEFPNNDQRSQKAVERIMIAVAHLLESNSLPSAATARSHAIIATAKHLTGSGISQTTLHKPKYLVLWHPGYYQPEAKACVIDEPEKLSADEVSSDLAQNHNDSSEAEKPETALTLEESENYTNTPLMKGLCVLSGTSVPTDGSCPVASSGGESEGGDVPKAVPVENSLQGAVAKEMDYCASLPPTATSATAADLVRPVATNTLDPNLSRLTKIRLEAVCKAREAVRRQQLFERCRFTREELMRHEAIAKMRLFWESGESVLMDEVRAWAADHPGEMPEVPLPNALTVPANQPQVAADDPLEPLGNDEPTTSKSAPTTAALVVLPTNLSLKEPSTAQREQRQPSNRRLQPVEILTSPGEWVGGYFVHSCIAVVNLLGQERRNTLFNADGEIFIFDGQIRPPQNR